MFGVVLWSDVKDRKAVIWCEDHGDLAFYRQRQEDSGVGLDAGDWVQFDLTVERHLRFAHNPRLVAEGMVPDLSAGMAGARPPRPRRGDAGQEMGQILAFRPRIEKDGQTARGLFATP